VESRLLREERRRIGESEIIQGGESKGRNTVSEGLTVALIVRASDIGDAELDWRRTSWASWEFAA
jgi:hypothetical protein